MAVHEDLQTNPETPPAPGYWMASDGRWYPPSPAPASPPSKKKSHKMRWTVLGVVAVIIIIIVAAGSGGGSSKKAATTPRAPSAPTAVYKVGDTATTSGWQVTVYGAKDPWTSTNQFDSAAPSSRYVQVDVQVVNTKSSQEIFSSLMAFKLLDSANHSYTEALVSTQPGAPDGTVPAHGALRGFVTFEIPTSSTGLVLQVQGSLTAAGSEFALS
jgi:hypothetical protein